MSTTIKLLDVYVQKVRCDKCGHEWFPRKEELKICPHCKRKIVEEE